MTTTKLVEAARLSTRQLVSSTPEDRNRALRSISAKLLQYTETILEANEKDLANAKKQNLSAAFLDRLALDVRRIENLAKTVEEIAEQPEVAFQIIEEKIRPDGLCIQKQSIPLGVIGIIFESRPNVIIDCAALCIKSANAVLLKGGKEAFYTNQVLVKLVKEAIQGILPVDSIQVLSSKEEAKELMQLKGKVDLIIPRGGETLIEYVMENSKVPVIAHHKGLCHLYVDESANLEMAYQIIMNSKCQRPGVCNALETLILHRDLPQDFIERLYKGFKDNEIDIRVSLSLLSKFDNAKQALPDDWSTEYLDKVISILQVETTQEAIAHIQTFGTHHTEGIISENPLSIETFLNSIDASCIMVNASTRFNDGGELGIGAEIGISTTKLHAYGPMGAKELTTSRYVVTGRGHIRS